MWKKKKRSKNFTVQDTPLVIHFRVLNITIFDSWIIICDKQFLKKLYRKGTLADPSISDNDQLKGHKVVIIRRTCHSASGSSTPSPATVPASAYSANSSNVSLWQCNRSWDGKLFSRRLERFCDNQQQKF